MLNFSPSYRPDGRRDLLKAVSMRHIRCADYQCAIFAQIISIHNLEHRHAQSPREGLVTFCLDTKSNQKNQDCPILPPTGQTRPGVQSGFCALFLSAQNSLQVSNVIPVFSGVRPGGILRKTAFAHKKGVSCWYFVKLSSRSTVWWPLQAAFPCHFHPSQTTGL
ncbi:hypothetical protein Mucpa_6493 [Mucilaginibacter paludis DSM 18603]|uniref:Uncharacterized protein n=1 Tax=Mucilaginibacter paludis DSM 18603 TaxID=714943 RepID=H1Y9P4_9SPHI|nr:hypothetical protein Mucpa_6493 [Mucilaginibacter paludis DSM 18603]